MWLTSCENTMSFTNAYEKKKDFKRLEVLSLVVV